jgi:hypothetical protein
VVGIDDDPVSPGVPLEDGHGQCGSGVTELRGSYAQAGLFVYRPEKGKPRGLELAARWAFVDPDASEVSDRQHELTAALNWFFSGHANKITLDVSRLSLEQPGASDLVSHRARLQWDVHF